MSSHVTTQSSRNGLLLAAFGTTVPEARSALGHIEKKVAERFFCMDVFTLSFPIPQKEKRLLEYGKNSTSGS